MRHLAGFTLAVLLVAGLAASQAGRREIPRNVPRYTAQGQLVRPQNYREWIFLSSGLGMEYSANAAASAKFTNVFVTPGAYHAFAATGHWPGKTMFVLEEREASSKGSINKGGHFQASLERIAVAVKDESRFPDKWAYFSFGLHDQNAAANPKQSCWQCHNQHGAVDNTFVQFYPTLRPIAQKFGVFEGAR